MAVIAEDTRLTIATRLANLNYKEKLDALQEKLNEAIEKRFTPARLQKEFPEAYLIYMDIITSDWNEKNDDAKKPASNLCVTLLKIFVRH